MRHRVWLSDESMRKMVLDLTRGYRFTPNACWGNAGEIALNNPKLVEYVEGVIGDPAIIHHAWCKFTDTDTYFDPTIGRDDCERKVFRVFTDKEFRQRLSDQWAKQEHPHWWPLLTVREFQEYLIGKKETDRLWKMREAMMEGKK